MRKRLTLLLFVLAAAAGVRATSPAAGAYPVEGKTYFLFANKYNSTDRYYLYWDNTNSALKRAAANTKEDTDYYKWTVTNVGNGVYTITNVGTSTKLTWNSSTGLTLGAGTNLDLSKDVAYTACVSLYENTAHWLCVSNSSETFASNLKFGSYQGTNTSYSTNFVFEEVFSTPHSLTDGSFYTIYCDNDNKQWLSDNGSTLVTTTTAPTAASSDCIWQCIVSGDYYNFKNLATGRYMGWRNMQTSAYNFTVATGAAKHTGCATIYGVAASRYLNNNVNGNFDQGTNSYNKVTTDYCSDYRFDAVTPTYGTPVTSLGSLSNSTAYVITNARATWNFADNATAMNAVAASNGYNLMAESQHIAIIYYNGDYYLFSVNEGKYLTANNTLTTKPSDNEAVTITSTGNESYPWFFKFKNVANKNINIGGSNDVAINNHSTIDAGNSNKIIAAAAFDATAALAMFSTRNVSYILRWSDGTQIGSAIDDVTVTLSGDAAEFLPAAFSSPFCTFSYSPSTISAETTEVNVTATWNGPFQLSDSYASAKWYTVGIHSAYEDANHIWKYDSGNSDIIATEAVATNAYASLSDKNYFCFVGNPYDGFSIYNKAAGSGMTLYKSTTNAEHARMAAEGSLFIPGASSESGKTIANGYACFILKDGSVRLNCYDTDSYNVNGWTDSGNGSTCWFKTPSSYPLNFLNTLVLDAPVGSVGTVDVAADVLSAGKDLKDYFASYPFYFATANAIEMNMVLQILNKLDEASEITLTEGYYRVVSAVAGFNAAAAWYYNPAVSTTNIVWAKAATTTEHQVNSIFKFTANENKWNIYSPNAQQYITTGNGTWDVQNAALGDAAGLEVTSIGAAQYTLKQSNNAQTLHAGGHENGSGTSGNLITWNSNGQGGASTWYIVKVDELPLTLNDGGDGYYYATVCLPFDVTLSAACAYTLTLNAGKTGLTMSEATDNVPAGTPVMLRHTKGTVTASIANNAATSAPLTTTALTGTYTAIAGFDGRTNYVLGTDDTKVGFFHWSGTTLNANRAYVAGSGGEVKGFVLNFDDDETGIEGVKEVQEVQGAIYNLAGQRISKMQKGINIVNGKKVLK